jgi:cholesterol oxidase
MTRIDRRQVLAGLAAGTGGMLLGGGAARATSLGQLRQAAPSMWNVQKPPQYTPNLVIGSGFGGAVTALRMAQAGQTVTVVERGFKWPTGPWLDTFSNDTFPDGRAFWFRTSAKMIAGGTSYFSSFGGVMDASVFPNMTAWHGACVGGGSMVFTGCMIQPEPAYFQALFGNVVDYNEMNTIYYPRVRQMLQLSPMPADIYNSQAFGHSRVWDQQVRQAGYTPVATDSIFNWNVIRAELNGQSRQSATVGLSNHGNSNGAKFDLNQNYLMQAQATGLATIYPGFEITMIGRESGRYLVQGILRQPDGTVLGTSDISCDRLFLAANSIGTSKLLVAAQALGNLPNLNGAIGQGWGGNGDVIVTRSLAFGGLTEGTPCASKILEPNLGLPVTFENWYVPGLSINVGVVASLGMVFDQTNRGSFSYDPKAGAVTLNWPANGNADAWTIAGALNDKLATASKSTPGVEPFFPPLSGYNWTAHPLGGAVIGKATDAYGRVDGYKGLYVMDGALLPGSAGAVNPSLTIAALAERNIENIIQNGG